MRLFILFIVFTGLIFSSCGDSNPDKSMELESTMQTESSESTKTVDSAQVKSPEFTQGENSPTALVCVVTGEEADPEMYAEHEGQKYYFCCEKCQKLFNKNPQKYISKN